MTDSGTPAHGERRLQTSRTGTIVLAIALFVLGPAIGIVLVAWIFSIFR